MDTTKIETNTIIDRTIEIIGIIIILGIMIIEIIEIITIHMIEEVTIQDQIHGITLIHTIDQQEM